MNQLYAYKYPHFFSPFLGCAVQHEDLSFPDQGPNPALGGQSLNQWTIREAPLFHSFKTPLISCYSLRNPPQLSDACINIYIQLYEFRTSFSINLICFHAQVRLLQPPENPGSADPQAPPCARTFGVRFFEERMREDQDPRARAASRRPESMCDHTVARLFQGTQGPLSGSPSCRG